MDIPPPPGPQQPQGGQYPPPGPYGAPPGQGQGPAPYGYQSWGQGYPPHSPYPPPAPPPPVNGFAIAALVLGILCFLPLIGLILGLIALAQIRRKGERGKGMAIAGMILSGIGTAFLVFAFASGGAAEFWEGFKEGAREGATFSVDKGECFDAPGGSLEGVAYDVDEVPCAGEHDGEVFANFQLDNGGYPGDTAITEAADDKCYTLQHTYAMDSWALPDDVDIYYFTPTRQSWDLGDREISCLFGNVDASAGLTGSLRSDETTLDADQIAYLKADQVHNEAMESVPLEGNIEDDLPGHKQWATRVSGALTEQVGILRGHDWGADAQGPVTALVKDLDAAQKEWQKAGTAADLDAYYEHYVKAESLTDPKGTITARKALGLATTPPTYDEEPGESGGSTGGGGAEV
ncbi:DUF4190 domain-containing protein [Streptomyces flaveus]|uniref:Membrane protein n=1 Tax=Streptomyces flaveus TaxID=66370 RepID=A0A917V9G5_9ACTN|nr:DUF4190 domain-containing protein [Streptomyces flaveus]GGK53982.1 membrane protein [Streptomyces flaveus]